MKLSPQSQAVIDRLLEGHEERQGRVAVGPLNETARSLLKVLVQHFADLSRMKGEDRASRLRDKFIAEIKSAANEGVGSVQSTLPRIVASSTPSNWKIQRLRCQSIRGVAPPGEDFEFDFHGSSNLLYGPNGSGKSSLLGAIFWVLTGEAVVDAAVSVPKAPMYKPVEGSTAGAKLRDWPIVATLPTDSDVATAKVQCWAELLLVRPADGMSIRLRRAYESPLQALLDGATWIKVDDLEQVGICPLDLQLSILAPTIFGRRSIEEAEHTRNILGLMLGFDDLDQLGDLASQMSGNRTRLAKTEKAAIDLKVTTLRESLRLLAGQLPEGTDFASTIAALAAVDNLTVAQIDVAMKALEDGAKDAEKHLAEVLGLFLQEGKPAGNLADRLTVAVDRLAKGFSENFPSLHAIDLKEACTAKSDLSPETQLAEMEAALQTALTDACAAISRRYEWWNKEIAPGSKATLLLKAAEHFEPTDTRCPVCERPIDDPRLVKQLTDLKALDNRLAAEVRTFFNDLIAEIRKVVPETIADLSTRTIQQRLQADWHVIRDELLGESFAKLTATCDTHISSISIEVSQSALPALLPDNCDSRFEAIAAPFVHVATTSFRAIAMLQSASSNLRTLSQALDNLVTAAVDGSLLTQLTKGKSSAQLVKPLVAVAKELNKSKRTQQEIDSSRAQLKVLADLEAPLDQLKLLSKYAETAVREEFDLIKDTTTDYLRHMYPESPTGMEAGKLRLGKGKDKSVEALLSGTTFEVPGQYFANASLQRAIALAFYFALLKRHPRGLGFIVMDDPILSLDEEHRERWSANILRPTLTTTQVLLATHQRQFLRHCGIDFAAERIVELNPRDRRRRVSSKPGDRLRHAKQQLFEQNEHLAAATTMRKFREDVLISMDAYSPTAFFDMHNLSQSAQEYGELPAHNPLAGKAQRMIFDCLKHPHVRRVVDPASHSMTEADVTRAMVEDCYNQFDQISSKVVKELARLDRLRERSLRSAVIEASIIPFPSLNADVCWNSPIELPMVGAAAAKSNPWSVEFHDVEGRIAFRPSIAVQVSGNSLEPIAHAGHWILLANEDEEVRDGDLVAACDDQGTNYLRRVWSDGRSWVFQSVNPVRPTPTVSVNKRLAGIRKAIGVLFRPAGRAMPTSGEPAEWCECASSNTERAFMGCKTIDVRGDSLNPIAREGQKVLVDEPLSSFSDCPEGELAVLQFKDEMQGSIIKQVFATQQKWILVSPNPVDRVPPLLIDPKDLLAVWVLRGVLFDSELL